LDEETLKAKTTITEEMVKPTETTLTQWKYSIEYTYYDHKVGSVPNKEVEKWQIDYFTCYEKEIRRRSKR